jgi:hypothetical protein
MVRAGLALNDEGMTKSEKRVAVSGAPFDIRSFELPSSFVIRHSSFVIPPQVLSLTLKI